MSGDVSGARSAYSDALAVRDTDVAALVGLARIDAFEGRTEEAIAGLRKAAAIAPQPETMALLGDLLSASGAAADARAAFATVRFEEQLGQIQSIVFDRVLTRFELDHGGASEAILAQAEDIARGPARTRPVMMRSHGRSTGLDATTKRAAKSRRRPPTGPPTPVCCSTPGRSPSLEATQPRAERTSNGRSRSDRHSIRPNGRRRFDSSAPDPRPRTRWRQAPALQGMCRRDGFASTRSSAN